MSIGLESDQHALADAVASWAAGAGLPEAVKASERDGIEAFADVWKQLTQLGIPSIGLDGGSILDAAVAVEACAKAMVPGPVLTTTLAGFLVEEPGIADGTVTVGLAMPGGLVWGAGTHLLTGAGLTEFTGRWAEPFDLSDRVAATDLPPVGDEVVEQAVVLAAAQAAGIARWCLETAVAYASVREQFGRTIGRFQSIKHLCAQLLERAESATALAWDAAAARDAEPVQRRFAATAAAATALDLAVRNAQDCIQILGGIGFTWEHDAHLYLRKAMSLRQLLGGTDKWRLSLLDQALAGVRRQVHIELPVEVEAGRGDLAAELARIGNDRPRLADAGLAAPHWPAPYGRGAGPYQQLLIDEEMARAGIMRPELGITAWALPPILERGTQAQRERFVMPSLRGELVWCQLFSEPGSGSDLASLRTKAERVDGGWRISGQKVWNSDAHVADWAICLARTNPEVPQHKGITFFLVDMSSPGIEVRPLREITGEEMFNEVFLDEVFVPDGDVVGDVDGGWALARTTLANERVAMGGSKFGRSVEFALDRVARLPEIDLALRLRIGERLAAATTAKALGLRATLRSVAGAGPGAESSVLKLVGVQERQESAEFAFDLLGADALRGGPDTAAVIHEALLTRCLSIAGGTTQVLRNVAAERILGLPRD